jgi:hypothetical protein
VIRHHAVLVISANPACIPSLMPSRHVEHHCSFGQNQPVAGWPAPITSNVMPYVYGMYVPPEVIYIIRHAEKPLKPPLSGVDYDGGQNEHSLLPRGWQRSGALAAVFHPDFGPVRAGLRTPTVLVAPSWGHPGKTAAHRSYQTIQGLSEQLGVPITSQFAQGQEQQLAESLVRSHSGVVLICWEHKHIPAIASSLPVVSGTAIPRNWPDDRYDIIWSFTLVPEPGPVRYTFGQIPQRLLAGDSRTVIPAGIDEPEIDVGGHKHREG